jgi:hypothetical protein
VNEQTGFKQTAVRDGYNPNRGVVSKGANYAAMRFPESDELQRILQTAVLVESPNLDEAIDVIPPSRPGEPATIRFDPDRIAALAREHRYPEWVVSATLERVVLAQSEQWPLPEPDAAKVAAHRDRCRRARSSEARSRESA